MAPRARRRATAGLLLGPVGTLALRLQSPIMDLGSPDLGPWLRHMVELPVPHFSIDNASFLPRTWLEARNMANGKVRRMREEELHSLVRGSHFSVSSLSPEKGFYAGNTPAIPRLRIPALKMHDAGQGFRTDPEQAGTTTSFPCGLALAATWDLAIVRRTAAAIAQEFVGKGANVMLGTSISVHRVQLSGRNFESLAGEDPYLGSVMAFNYILGAQGQGVMTTVKHFAFSHQETNRTMQDSVVDDRTAWELYYPPFQAAIAAGAGAIMCSLNRVNGIHACENSDLLERDLKGKMRFPGFVMSEWYGTHNATAYQSGLDQDMPGGSDLVSNLISVTTPEKVAKLPHSLNTLRKAAANILTSIYRLRLDTNPGCKPPACNAELASNQRTAAHSWVAREAATNSIILLKNEGSVLPLERAKAPTIAVFGVAADAKPALRGEDYYAGGGSGHVPLLNVTTPLQAIRKRASEAGIRIVDDLKSASVCVVIVAATSGEGVDRKTLRVDGKSDILTASKSCNKTVVLMQTPGAVLTKWRWKVAAIANLFLGGEETANAWAAAVFGDVSPSGKLPIALPEDFTDIVQPSPDVVQYSEHLETSYRSPKVKAAYPFGHGLSYASFELDVPRQDICWSKLPCLKVNVTNNHTKYSGREVVQAYIHFRPELGLPRLMLKAFAKTGVLKPGGREEVWVLFNDQPAASAYDPKLGRRVLQPHSEVHVGVSSADIRYKITLPF